MKTRIRAPSGFCENCSTFFHSRHRYNISIQKQLCLYTMGVRIALFVCGIAQQTRANLEYSELFPYFHVAFDLERPQLQALQNRYFLHLGSPGRGIPLLHQGTVRIQSNVEASDAVGVEGCRRGIDDTKQTVCFLSEFSWHPSNVNVSDRTGVGSIPQVNANTADRRMRCKALRRSRRNM